MRRTGLTVIELLVAVGILAVLLGLLVPAVQKIRASSTRSACQNNMRQVGLALQNYHATRNSYPSGISSPRASEPLIYASWLLRLTPYADLDPLWQESQSAYRANPRPFSDPHHPGQSTPVRLFGCPSDPRVGITQVTHEDRRVALTSYLGVIGDDYQDTGGVLYVDSRVRAADITDGASNTVIIGERPPSTDLWFGWWYAGFGQDGTGSGDMLLGVEERNSGVRYAGMCPLTRYYFGPGTLDEQCDLFHFWSLHNGGTNFGFCDGSVRFLAYSGRDSLRALASRAKGDSATLP